MSRVRQVLRDTGIVALGTAVLLLVLEGVARFLDDGPKPLVLPPKAPGAYRIVALGGSTVQGVPDGAQGFVHQLDLGLRELARGRRVDVVNLGRAGASSDAVRERLVPALDVAPDLVILLTGHNEYLRPLRRTGLRAALRQLRIGSTLVDALAKVGFGPRRYDDPSPDRLYPIDRSSALFRDTVAGYRENLEAIVGEVGARGIPLVLGTAPANLADWPPVHERIAWAHPNPDYERDVRDVERALREGDLEHVVARTQELESRFGDDAMLHYLRARALRVRGSPDLARAEFRSAKELDPYPWRALDAMNETVRAQAGTPGVAVVDVERVFQDVAPEGLVGFGLVGDNCHPTPLGNALIAQAIASAMARHGWLLDPGREVGDVATWLARTERALGDEQQRRRARVRWLLSNALYAMKTPFFHYDAARDYLQQARRLAPGDWQVWANLGVLSVFEGEPMRGRRQLQRAEALKGAPLDPDDRALVPYLTEALERLELEEAA